MNVFIEKYKNTVTLILVILISTFYILHLYQKIESITLSNNHYTALLARDNVKHYRYILDHVPTENISYTSAANGLLINSRMLEHSIYVHLEFGHEAFSSFDIGKDEVQEHIKYAESIIYKDAMK